MVHTVNAIVTAILALGAAAPILAAPVERRIDSGFSSVNSRAPILPPSSGVGSVGSGTPAPVLYLISGLNLTGRAIDDELYVAARAPGSAASVPAAEAPAASVPAASVPAAEAPAAEAPAAPAAPAPGRKVVAIPNPKASQRFPYSTDYRVRPFVNLNAVIHNSFSSPP